MLQVRRDTAASWPRRDDWSEFVDRLAWLLYEQLPARRTGSNDTYAHHREEYREKARAIANQLEKEFGG